METGPTPVAGKAFQKEAEYWTNRYMSGGLSGGGSYGEGLARKLAILKDLDFKTITEIGCGDFNFGKNILFQQKLDFDNYYGVDISDFIVERNRKFYPKAKFEVMDNGLEVPKSDLLLCVDVLYHIYDDANYNQTLSLLKSLWKKYLVISAYEREPEDFETKGHLRIRKFDPSFFGVPKVKEVIEDEGTMYLYVFER